MEATVYEAGGGMPFFEQLVGDFYTGVQDDDVLAPLYPEAPDFSGARRRLTLFLAQVGMSSGPKFVATVQETGLLFLAWGCAILLAVVLVTLLVGHALKIAYDDLLGIASGVTGNPAILAYASRSVATDRPDLGYALIFPGATLVKILIVDVLTVLFLR